MTLAESKILMIPDYLNLQGSYTFSQNSATPFFSSILDAVIMHRVSCLCANLNYGIPILYLYLIW